MLQAGRLRGGPVARKMGAVGHGALSRGMDQSQEVGGGDDAAKRRNGHLQALC